MSFIDFRSVESIGKSSSQIYNCAKFIFDNISALNSSLQKATETKKKFKIIENKYTGTFRFFPKKLQAVSTMNSSTQEEIIEPPSKLQKIQ